MPVLRLQNLLIWGSVKPISRFMLSMTMKSFPAPDIFEKRICINAFIFVMRYFWRIADVCLFCLFPYLLLFQEIQVARQCAATPEKIYY